MKKEWVESESVGVDISTKNKQQNENSNICNLITIKYYNVRISKGERMRQENTDDSIYA